MKYNVIIIGAGPAGYVAAIRAGQLGMKTLVIEKAKPGGMCLNWGCIPSKSLIESAKLFTRIKTANIHGVEGFDPESVQFNWQKAVQRAREVSSRLTAGVEFLLKKNGVEFETGEAMITGQHTITVNNRNLESDNIIIATGSLPEKSTHRKSIGIQALYKLEKLPKKIAVEGTGPVAVEFAQLFNMLGIEVFMQEPKTPLIPDADDYINDYLKNKLSKKGIVFCQDGEAPENILWLNANRRKAVIPQSEIPLQQTEDGFIEANDFLMTSVEGIYAIGDVNGKSYLAHAASAQGLFVINHIKGIKGDMHHDRYPMNVYSVPEIAQVGKTEQQLQAAGIDYKLSSYPLSANAKAQIQNETEGIVRILSDKKYGEVLGVQIIAENATDMIAEAAAYIEMEATVYNVANTIHAHPTISEVFMEAGFDAFDKAIHK